LTFAPKRSRILSYQRYLGKKSCKKSTGGTGGTGVFVVTVTFATFCTSLLFMQIRLNVLKISRAEFFTYYLWVVTYELVFNINDLLETSAPLFLLSVKEADK
jgi:hypothetical protein